MTWPTIIKLWLFSLQLISRNHKTLIASIRSWKKSNQNAFEQTWEILTSPAIVHPFQNQLKTER